MFIVLFNVLLYLDKLWALLCIRVYYHVYLLLRGRTDEQTNSLISEINIGIQERSLSIDHPVFSCVVNVRNFVTTDLIAP